MRRTATLVLVVFVIAAMALALSGCYTAEGDAPGWAEDWLGEGSDEDTATVEQAQDDWDAPMPGDSHGHGTEVLMMGRSVMGSWFDYWGYDWAGPVAQEGYALYYREIASPPDIGSDAASAIASVPDGTIVFFKLCFVDFWASSAGEQQANVDENIGYVREVMDACSGRDITLIVGNALPQIDDVTTRELVATHRAYNDALDALAATDDRVVVFDQYDILADRSGVLPRGLSVSPSDSHLNNVAYGLLDLELFELLDSLTGGM